MFWIKNSLVYTVRAVPTKLLLLWASNKRRELPLWILLTGSFLPNFGSNISISLVHISCESLFWGIRPVFTKNGKIVQNVYTDLSSSFDCSLLLEMFLKLSSIFSLAENWNNYYQHPHLLKFEFISKFLSAANLWHFWFYL